MQLQLATTRVLNGNELACYVEDKPANEFDFWATREQIGTFLGYANPRAAIRLIHKRNKKRLDKFSRGVRFELPSGGTQTATVYSFKGLLEICRFSNQHVANQVIDVLWDIFEEIRNKGYYMTPQAANAFAEVVKERDSLRTINEGLKNFIQENSCFYLLGQAISLVKGLVSVAEAAKIFSQHGCKLGQNRLFKELREKKILCKRKGRQHNQPTQKAIDKGLCYMGLNLGSKGTPYLTPKGLQEVANWYAKEAYPLLALISGCDALHE